MVRYESFCSATLLLDCLEESIPTDTILTLREDSEESLTHDMILRHEAPIARVRRIVAVVAHHKVVVHSEGVGVSLHSIHKYLVAIYTKVVALVLVDDTLVEGQIVDCKRNCSTLLRNPNRSEVVDIPRIVLAVREYIDRRSTEW